MIDFTHHDSALCRGPQSKGFGPSRSIAVWRRASPLQADLARGAMVRCRFLSEDPLRVADSIARPALRTLRHGPYAGGPHLHPDLKVTVFTPSR
jgi:hypothetical protein